MEHIMNKREETKYSMFRAIDEVFKKNEKMTAVIPALNESIAEFRKYFYNLSELNEQYLSVAKGANSEKHNAQEIMIEEIVKIKGILYVLSRKIKDENLKAVADQSITDLRKMRTNDMLSRAKILLQKTNEFIDKLKVMYPGIDEDIKKFAEVIDNYEKALGSKENKNQEGHLARKNLELAFSEIDEIVNEDIDNLMEIVKGKDPDFYNQYQDARTIRDLGSRKKKDEPVT
jgi:hypothetical protein